MEKKNDLAKSDLGIDYFEKRNQSFLKFFKGYTNRKTKGKTTNDGYKCSINRFEEYLEELNMKDVTFKQVDFAFCKGFKKFLEELSDIENSTKAKYFFSFKHVIKEAQHHGYFRELPCNGITGIKHEHERLEYLTLEELKSMINTETPYINKEISPTREFFIFSCLTALPHKECRALKWEHFEQETIDGKVQWHFKYKRFKTDTSNTIPITDDAREYLSELWSEKTSSPYVFPNLKYSAHENSKLQKWAGMAGVRKKITPHCGRATFANLFIKIPEYNIRDLMELMGHKEVKTTLCYIGTSLMEKRRAIRKFPKVLN